MSDPYLDAHAMLRAFADRSLSPVEVTEGLLARIDRVDGDLNAWCHLDPQESLAQAKAAEDRWGRGEPAGLLDGVPVAIKDVFLTRGWPTLRGSALVDRDQEWAHDAPTVASLRRHGAVLLGKTTTPELGWKGVTDAPVYGVTRNPWDPALTPGGSSGGSSAALASGTAPLALGTDGGGSVRIPAAFTSTVGFKPTWGRIPLWPVSPYGPLAHAGPMTRTVADTALLLNVLAEFDPRDPFALPQDGRDYRGGLGESIAGLRVAFSPGLGFVDYVDPEIAVAVAAAAQSLADLGAIVEQVDPPGMADPVATFRMLWEAGAAQATAGYDTQQRTRLDPGLAAATERGAAAGAVDYLHAAAARGALAVTMSQFHTAYDLLLTPTIPITPFEAGREVPVGWERTGGWPSWTPFTYPFNLTQQPAISVPCGFTAAGLPIGLQVVGPRCADALVLRVAAAYERANPWHERRPPLAA